MIETYSPHQVKDHLPRARIGIDQRFVSVTTSSIQIAGPNQRRWALFIGAPNANFTDVLNASQNISQVSCAATGVKLAFTVPQGAQAQLLAASAFARAGATQALDLQYIPNGGTAETITRFTPSGTWSGPLALNAGDVVQWDCTTALAASTEDLTLSITQTQGVGRVTISLKKAAVIDQGMNMYPGQTPFPLLFDYLGNAIREDVFAVCASGTATIPIWDLFEP